MSKNFLNTNNRPLTLQKIIEKVGSRSTDPFYSNKYLAKFNQDETAAQSFKFRWTIHGNLTYQNMIIPEAKLVQQIIINNYHKGQKDFIILEPGAGAFFTIEILARSINIAIQEQILPNDIKITLIGIRIEPNLSAEYVQEQNCDIHRLGNFKYENFFQSLKEKSLENIVGNVDFIFSNYTWQHFYDWMGVLVDTFKILKPLGIMMTHHKNNLRLHQSNDVNYEFVEYDPLQTTDYIVKILHSQNNEVLVKQHPDGSPFGTIITLRKHANELLIPLSYYDSRFDVIENMLLMSTINNSLELIGEIPNKDVGEYSKNPYDKQKKYKIWGDKSLFNIISESLLSHILDDILYINNSKDSNILLKNSKAYSTDELEKYALSEYGGQDNYIPRDLIPFGERYKATNFEELNNKLNDELISIINLIEGNSNSFMYQNQEYYFYEFTDTTILGV